MEDLRQLYQLIEDTKKAVSEGNREDNIRRMWDSRKYGIKDSRRTRNYGLTD